MKRRVPVHIYTGTGKGKTTAALGLAFRAVGWGMKVCVLQFMKKGANGEWRASKLLGKRLKVITFDQTHPMFCHKSKRKEAAGRLARKLPCDLKKAEEMILSGDFDIVILDEVINCLKEGFITKRKILSLINMQLRSCELILTGRSAPGWLIESADYVTDMRLLKHPYKNGLKARKGIEF